jgi:sortase A
MCRPVEGGHSLEGARDEAMPDRRTVDELTIKELEELLLVRRREARAERMRRLREVGRLPAPADGALPHEDLAHTAAGILAPEHLAEARARGAHVGDVEPLGRGGRARAARSRAASGRWSRVRDRLLLVLEVAALLGLVGVLASSLLNLKSLNAEYAQASLVPTTTPTPLAGGILPGEHAPPEEPGSVPSHLRNLVEGDVPPAVPIPTPGPEAPTRIVVPAIGVDALVVAGDSPQQLKLGVGHHLASANPGERGNMVLSAHNDIYGEIFRHLSDLELGDDVIVYAGEQPYHYTVTAKQIVDPTDVHVLAPTTRPVATLISCYPYMVDTHRIVVIAELR